MKTKDYYQAHCDGHVFSDEDLVKAEKFFKELADKLYEAGPAFTIPAKEAVRTYISLNGYRVNRKLEELK